MKKIVKLLSVIFIMTILLTAFTGCLSFLSYEGRTLENAVVGVFYSQNIDTAESKEGDNIRYQLKEGSTLPDGLSLDNGSIMGVPTKIVEAHSFTIVSVTENQSAEATFTISVGRGALVYNNAEVNVIIHQENSGSVAFATNGVNIQYELVDGTMPNGLTIDPDGTIKGSYPRLVKGREITIRASAQDCESAEAKIKINVVNPFLTFNGKTLVDAKQNVSYAASVAYVEEKEAKVSYSLKEGSSLPEGLILNEEGIISGTPSIVKRGEAFTVVAKAKDFSDTEAEFLIDVILDRQSETEGQIVGFNGGQLEEAYQAEYYLNQTGVSKGVVALNNNNITYTLAEGEEENFPEGLTLYSNGAIFGMTQELKTCTFAVTASAKGCKPVTSTFTLSTKGSKIKYDVSMNAAVATKGEVYSYSVASAFAGEGVEITYITDEENSKALNAIGLSVASNGLITGTPTKSLKSMNFNVIARAEGYTDAQCTVYLHIQEPLTAMTKFEAEYTNLTGKIGTGYSGAPGDEDLIEADDSASNGHFINYLHNDKISLEFVIYADTATMAELFLILGSELGNITLNPNNFEISVNGQIINYANINVAGGAQVYTGFGRHSAGTINLKEGENLIKLAIKSNTLKEGSTGGPGIDCIELISTTTLKWRPRVFNIGG